MEAATNIFLEYGILGAIVFFLGYFVWKQRTELSELNRLRVEDKENEIQRKDSDSEKFISIIEKSLTALTKVEQSLFENATNIPLKVRESIREEHKPLIDELRKFLENKNNG